MRGQDLLESLGYIDEDLVADAEEAESLSGGMGWKRWATLAACIVAVVASVAVMATQQPFGDEVILPPAETTNNSPHQTPTTTSSSSSTTSSASRQTTGTAATQSQTTATTGFTTRIHICSFPTRSSSTTGQTTPSTGVTLPTDSATSTQPTQPTPSTQPTQSTSSAPPSLEGDLLEQLLKDYASTTPTQPSDDPMDSLLPPTIEDTPSPQIDRYIGTYGDVVAVRIKGDDNTYIAAGQTLTVAGITVHIPAGYSLWLYRDGEFLTLPQAYEAGWITAADVEDIHQQLNR